MAIDTIARGLALFGKVGNAVTAAKNRQGSTVLAQSGAAVALTGSTTETTLASVSVPANALGANGRLEFKARLSTTNNADVKTINVKLGGTTFFSKTVPSASVAVVIGEIANRNATNSQVGGAANLAGSTSAAGGVSTGTEDTTTALTFAITGQLATSSDTLQLEDFQVILYPKG